MSLQALFDLFQTTYCERSGPSPFAEPLNAITNLAFVIAAMLAYRRVRRFPHTRRGIRLLPWALSLVAIGSTFYHTYRSPLTFLIDVVSLSIFILGALFLSLHLVMRNPYGAGFGTTAFLGLQSMLVLLVSNDFLNGSIPYLVTLVFSFPVLVVSVLRHPTLWWQGVRLGLVYAGAIVFRSMDQILCPWLPLGTHFLWHLAGAATGLYVIRFISSLDHASRGLSGSINEVLNAAQHPLQRNEG